MTRFLTATEESFIFPDLDRRLRKDTHNADEFMKKINISAWIKNKRQLGPILSPLEDALNIIADHETLEVILDLKKAIHILDVLLSIAHGAITRSSNAENTI